MLIVRTPRTFVMGAPAGEKGSRPGLEPLRTVTIGRSFAMAVHETIESHFRSNTIGSNRPAEKVSVDDAGTPNPDDLHAAWAGGARAFRLTPR